MLENRGQLVLTPPNSLTLVSLFLFQQQDSDGECFAGYSWLAFGVFSCITDENYCYQYKYLVILLLFIAINTYSNTIARY